MQLQFVKLKLAPHLLSERFIHLECNKKSGLGIMVIIVAVSSILNATKTVALE